MWLNCKVIKKWQSSPISTSTPLFRFIPLSRKKFHTHPPPSRLVAQFLGGGGVPTMMIYTLLHIVRIRKIQNMIFCNMIENDSISQILLNILTLELIKIWTGNTMFLILQQKWIQQMLSFLRLGILSILTHWTIYLLCNLWITY